MNHGNGKILKRMNSIDKKGDIKSVVLGNISNTEDITQSITDYQFIFNMIFTVLEKKILFLIFYKIYRKNV